MSEKFVFDKKLQRQMFLRHMGYQWGWNYERQQASGVLFVLTPALKRIYKDRPAQERERAIERHLEFFNTHATLAPLLFGLVIAMEANTTEEEKDSITSIKTGLMGPVAGLGDGLFWFTIWPICASIGATMAVDGNLFGAIFTFVVFNIINQGIKWIGFKTGFTKGKEIIDSGTGDEIIKRISGAATVLGLCVAGSLVASTVSLTIPLEFSSGEGKIVIQELIDKIMPCFLPVLVTVFCYWRLSKSGGKCAVKLIFGIMLISIVLAYFGIF